MGMQQLHGAERLFFMNQHTKNMKKLVTLTALLLLSGLVFVSCSKDDDGENENGNNTPTGNMMKATINGTAWEATLAVVASNDPIVVSCTGSDSESKQLMFSINNPTGTGEYPLGGNLTNPNMGRWTQGLGQNDTYTTMLGQGAGTVNITAFSDTEFSGTFEFTAKNSAGEEVSIAAGEFSATFSK